MGGYVDDVNIPITPIQTISDRFTWFNTPIYSQGLGLWTSLAMAAGFLIVILYVLRNRK